MAKETMTELARTLSYHSVKNERGELSNPFLGPENPLLVPNSGKFSLKAWLQTLMSITSRDPERYPKRVAGVAYKNLSAYGFGEPTDYQKTFGNYPLKVLSSFKKLVGKAQKTRIQILRDLDGLVRSGEMLLVLGRPGSGCSTLLKTISGETDGFFVAQDSHLNYQGIPKETMHKDFRGECIYQAEVDVHFPQLTVGQTLDFAARARAPRNRLPGVSRDMYAEHLRDVIMAIFGLSHTVNTMVGNDFIRGVSGGERKRVSIAEAAIAGSPLQCWDNSTRGLDSATALEFVRTLRMSTELTGATAIVTLYQASQSIYDVFDKVAILYEGRQIYFGDIHAAKTFFINLGFQCPSRQTTGDFLTSLTNPAERVVREGFEGKTPYTPDEFAAAWQKSEDRTRLLQEIEEFDSQYPIGGPSLDEFKQSRKALQARSQRVQSPYTLSVPMQVKLCMQRSYQRLKGDLAVAITGIIFNAIMALVIGSVFYNLPNETSALYSRGALLFFAVLLAAFASALEILTLYAQRPIVEKQSKYAFYHPFAEAIASMICDLPNKIGTAVGFNLSLYFMTNLRRTPGHFFVFLLFSFACTLTMSMYFRCIAALSRTFPQAMAPASIFSLALVIYTGFTIPTKDMHPWFRWLNYLNPVGYAFESLMINEFHNRTIPCTRYVPQGPGYGDVSPDEKICATTGAAAGADFVDGDTYLAVNFNYEADHLWRNLGIMIALMVFGCFGYLVATEYISAEKSKGEVLLFRRNRVPNLQPKPDEEAHGDDRLNVETLAREKTLPDAPASIQKQTAVFHWDSVCYDIKVKKEERRLLDEVDGWVKPGTLTALMGVTGAGKTTLLDVLANRVTMGVVSGQMLVDGRLRDAGFQRKTGYVQQQDLHLATSTVREALTFSAILRQPKAAPHAEKLAYVDEVIKVLEMETYADAVIGVPGEGLNVEQRKRLTIGVELAAKPALLLFLDEPTSGLDSQTAWSICALLRKLADNGQAILCTIHQPSAILFQGFDRLLFLAMEGKTLYFGEIGESSKTFTSYFERNGARPCGQVENPAEWMLEITGAAHGSECTQDWPAIWNNSEERKAVKVELARMKENLSQQPISVNDPDALRPFAASFGTQLWTVLMRAFQQYWRTPSYLYSKVALCLFSALFIGFSFWKTPNSLQGLQNQLYAVFMLLTIFSNFCSQIMPHFVTQRALYEVRERQSRTYSWKVFILSNILVEIPWNSLMAVLVFVSWYYPIGLRQNAVEADQVAERGALMFLFTLTFMIFAGTFAHMAIAGVKTAEGAGTIINLLFSLSLIFCGVLATPEALPGFWIFMYRVSPFTYLVSGMLSVGLANARISCSTEEFLRFSPPPLSTCSNYLTPYIEVHGGYLVPDSMNSTTECVFCTGSETNIFLKGVSSEYGDRWRNFGISLVYVVFNIAMAIGLYWLARVPKGKREKSDDVLKDKDSGSLEKVSNGTESPATTS
ncbi:ABC transporter-like protein [Cenococcum geophilum]